jgi:hypothetical protein
MFGSYTVRIRTLFLIWSSEGFGPFRHIASFSRMFRPGAIAFVSHRFPSASFRNSNAAALSLGEQGPAAWT